jgi:hypothetical protein
MSSAPATTTSWIDGDGSQARGCPPLERTARTIGVAANAMAASAASSCRSLRLANGWAADATTCEARTRPTRKCAYRPAIPSSTYEAHDPNVERGRWIARMSASVDAVARNIARA